MGTVLTEKQRATIDLMDTNADKAALELMRIKEAGNLDWDTLQDWARPRPGLWLHPHRQDPHRPMKKRATKKQLGALFKYREEQKFMADVIPHQFVLHDPETGIWIGLKKG